MPRKKLKKFKEIQNDERVVEYNHQNSQFIKGNWQQIFKNQNPIVMELGCGYGEYTIAMAEKFKDKNFLGVDVKGDRIWKGLQMGRELKLENFAFLRTKIENLETFIDKNEISEIWITFPDPRPKQRDAKRRLTSPRFLGIYQQILQKNGILNLKTDDLDLFNFSLETFQNLNLEIVCQTTDLYNSDLQKYTFGVMTRYEKQFLNSCGGIKFIKTKFVK